MVANLDGQVKSLMRSNPFIRTVFTIIMGVSFMFIAKTKTSLITTVLAIKYIAIHELIHLNNSVISSKIARYLPYYCILISDIYALESFKLETANVFLDFLFKNSVFIGFLFYMLGMIVFILSLNKKNLKMSFYYIALAHLINFGMNLPAYEAIRLVIIGRFWLVFSAYLVCINDIFAYIIGKLIGRNQLFKLSPKKTIEGFLGAFISTIIAGFAFMWFRQRYNFLYDENDGINFALKVKIMHWMVPKLYLHCIIFVCFASLVAPFGGLLASAYKRYRNIKDFGDYIPGHGGMTDRMDCQFIMAVFMKLYIVKFILPREKNIFKEATYLLNKYSPKELLELMVLLHKKLYSR